MNPVAQSRDPLYVVGCDPARLELTNAGELEEHGTLAPVVLFKGYSFVFTQYANLYVVAVSTCNANAVALQLFLQKVRLASKRTSRRSSRMGPATRRLASQTRHHVLSAPH